MRVEERVEPRGHGARRWAKDAQALTLHLCSLPLQQNLATEPEDGNGQEEVQYGPQKVLKYRAGIGQADIQIGFWHLRVPEVWWLKVCLRDRIGPDHWIQILAVFVP